MKGWIVNLLFDFHVEEISFVDLENFRLKEERGEIRTPYKLQFLVRFFRKLAGGFFEKLINFWANIRSTIISTDSPYVTKIELSRQHS
ncbi:MAG: hypothetical protein A3I07_03235 [Candidatus Doudnabacteria bacterium RIFCSPLOWO2_02_FULL_42_9]|uniref:Uncharacterized protein n=1 Tax=Candidatus Doudnabacteria bacterium RIFCSPHIGHO2_01_FULL_41_86 TaxID=1817821 RepID=A0A1F5N8A3_9BACT|nr:MAG: hypothetical protein A2717_04020 [Candidatus Doudnabacteria bacterium RIFCSPHIGHO2_01_FULL_41_86]OGE74913.1 MAG: hypothetical protein A3K07_02340 [Candidatus Doudnabacteria bacterium RIFCSPHIGHO2_01_43_10]OGE85800.1 MAG: hypothetical protein A3E28_03360 [Candidatus Doudnabacteria bacterium RIFCSPHIGHO2_12_FULL_42_22]OGE87295.1 MAG: hypothetical protein A3C49_00985 [Candidatus Doudnabacteria bacterium RIFCSPHIGHO2_02_FULL_42_25]OGE92132.1 MAG: hypothetical protein A2895_00860 [Candidatus